MSLSSDLISQFVKVTKDKEEKKTDSTIYGTTVEYEGRTFVKLDGSDRLTPVSTTATVKPDERVTVAIKNHSAIITGNLSTPSASSSDVSEIGNKISNFEIVIADKVDTKELVAQTARIDTLVADNVTIKETLTAQDGYIQELEADNVTINEKLTAQEAEITTIKTDKLDANAADIKYATIENLNATNADIHNLDVDYAAFKVATGKQLTANEAAIGTLDSDLANFKELTTGNFAAVNGSITSLETTKLQADSAVITDLQSDVADIDTLIFGSASGETIQTSFANAVIAQLGNAQIKSAMIENITASKITSGDIITNNVHVKSEDGKLLISDETIQISDDTRVRVQIGKDASNDYSINIWDDAGNLMFSEGGITDSAIKEAIIRDDMVSETANIAASKLNIESLFETINNDGSHTLNSSKISMDAEGQTLDVAFTNMTTSVSNAQTSANTAQSTADAAQTAASQNASDIASVTETVTSQGTSISAIQGQISSKIWQQDITTATSGLNESVNTLNTNYTELNQTVSGLSSTVSSHTTQIANKADSSTVTNVSNKVTTLEQSLEGLSSTVSSHTTQISNKADSSTVTTVSNKVNTLEQSLEGLSSTVSSHTTQIANKADGSTVSTLSGKVTDLENDLDGFKTTVSNTYATTDDLTTSVSTLEGSIQANADAINLRVTKAEFNNLTIGGRNLIPNTDFKMCSDSHWVTYNSTTGTATIDKETGWICLESIATGDNLGFRNALSYYGKEKLIPGMTYTLQFEAYATSNVTLNYLYILSQDSGNYSLSSWTPAITTEPTRYTKTWTVSATDTERTNIGILIGCSTANNDEVGRKIYVRNIMLEQSTKPGAWRPSPSDAGNYLLDLDTRVTTAELKLEDDSIISTVISSSAMSTLLNSKADSSELGGLATLEEVDSKIANIDISGAIDSGISNMLANEDSDLMNHFASKTEVTQTANSITQNFLMANGRNLIKNSTGFAGLNFWEVSGNTNSTRITYGSDPSLDPLGIWCKFHINPNANNVCWIRQKFAATAETTYTFSAYINKYNNTTEAGQNGQVYFQLQSVAADNTTVNLKNIVLDNSIVTNGYQFYSNSYTVKPEDLADGASLAVCAYGYNYADFDIAGIMVHIGSVPLQWTLASGEVANTSVVTDANGIRVNQVDSNGNVTGYTSITHEEFAGYYDTDSDGSFEKVFYLNEDETVTKKVRASEEITMGAIKVINFGEGWAFVQK